MRTFSAVLYKAMHSWILFPNHPFLHYFTWARRIHPKGDSQPCIHDFTMQNEADKDNEDRHSTQKKSRKRLIGQWLEVLGVMNGRKTQTTFHKEWKSRQFILIWKEQNVQPFILPNPRVSPSLPSNAKCKHMNSKTLKTERIRKQNTRKNTTTDYTREEEVESFNVKKSRVLPIDRRELSNLFNSRIKR